jgi:hypothetical protein
LQIYTIDGNGERVIQTIDNQDTWILGFAFRGDAIAGRTICQTLDAGTTQGRLRLNGDGTLSVQRGTTTVATSTNSIITNVFYYIEFKHIIDNAAGLLEVRVDGAVWATFTGDTQATANAFANQIALGTTEATLQHYDFDDFYALDGVDQSIADPNSPPNNDYWGNTQIEALLPNGAGNYTEWTALVGAPTHWEAEDEVPPDEDTSYVESATLNHRDTYAFTNLSVVSATINGIQVLMRARETLAGAGNIARMYRNAGADDQGADIALQTSYNYHREIMGGDPIAAGAWTVANINAAQFGARVR